MLQIDEFDKHNQALQYLERSSEKVQQAFTVVDMVDIEYPHLEYRALAYDDLRIAFWGQAEYEYHVTGPRGEPVAQFLRGDHAAMFVLHAALMPEVK